MRSDRRRRSATLPTLLTRMACMASMACLAMASLSALAGLQGCAGLSGGKPEQGLHGTFKTYGPPRELADCSPFKTQMEMDECRRGNERVVEEPHQAVITIRNLETRETRSVQLDGQGSYRAVLPPGEYEVCMEGECSDPMTVRMGAFATYGQRLPRAAPAQAPALAPATTADSLKRSSPAP